MWRADAPVLPSCTRAKCCDSGTGGFGVVPTRKMRLMRTLRWNTVLYSSQRAFWDDFSIQGSVRRFLEATKKHEKQAAFNTLSFPLVILPFVFNDPHLKRLGLKIALKCKLRNTLLHNFG